MATTIGFDGPALLASIRKAGGFENLDDAKQVERMVLSGDLIHVDDLLAKYEAWKAQEVRAEIVGVAA